MPTATSSPWSDSGQGGPGPGTALLAGRVWIPVSGLPAALAALELLRGSQGEDLPGLWRPGGDSI